ncbi:MAG: hypothetical protein KGJ12_05635, partial [Gammaproteobacteria bacterium]|nr:hypothetical protein [Gammaproteobacteria bacterium]
MDGIYQRPAKYRAWFLLPLPPGEGWGEGESIRYPLILSFYQREKGRTTDRDAHNVLVWLVSPQMNANFVF